MTALNIEGPVDPAIQCMLQNLLELFPNFFEGAYVTVEHDTYLQRRVLKVQWQYTERARAVMRSKHQTERDKMITIVPISDDGKPPLLELLGEWYVAFWGIVRYDSSVDALLAQRTSSEPIRIRHYGEVK